MPLPDYVKNAVSEKKDAANTGLPDYVKNAASEKKDAPSGQLSKLQKLALGANDLFMHPGQGQGEALLNAASSVVSVPLSGLAGMAVLGNPFDLKTPYDQRLGKANEAASKVQEFMTYEPKTEGGKLSTGLIELPQKALAWAGGKAGGQLEKLGYPMAAATADTAIQALPVLLSLRGGVKVPKETVEAVVGDVKKGISKGVRPTVTGKKTYPQEKAYYAKATEGVAEIVRNKDSLVYELDNGEIVKGGLPKSLNEFSQAISQMKQRLFNEWDNMMKRSEGKGMVVDEKPLYDILDPILKDRTMKVGQNKNIRSEARELKSDFETIISEEGRIRPSEAQKFLTQWNDMLDSYYKNRGGDFTSKQAVLYSELSKALRGALDDAITSSEGKGYLDFRSRYGALKTIENEVGQRRIVDSRQGKSGFFDVTSAPMKAHAMMNLLKGDPTSAMALYGTEAIVRKYVKNQNNPNKIVTKMFEDVDAKLNPKKVTKFKKIGPAQVAIGESNKED